MKIIARDVPPRAAWSLEQAGIHPLLARLYAARGVLGHDERAALRERLEEMHGQLAEGVESVEEQMAEIGQDERAALLTGRRSLAALVAARDALARAHGALLTA